MLLRKRIRYGEASNVQVVKELESSRPDRVSASLARCGIASLLESLQPGKG